MVDVFCENCAWLATAQRVCRDLPSAELAWFSDTIIIYSADGSRKSFEDVAEASKSFLDELIDSKIPVRGALAFGDFYADKANGLFLGKALIDACEYGEKFNWLGFALHPSALQRMAEVSQTVSDSTYQQRNAEFKNPKTAALEKENVVAYVVGPGSIMPVAGGHRYLHLLEEMAASTDCTSAQRKYENSIQFIKSYNGTRTVNRSRSRTSPATGMPRRARPQESRPLWPPRC